jgi:hypothetical protein
MSPSLRAVAAALVLGVVSSHIAMAQAPAAGRRPVVWVGAGGALPLSEPGVSRRAGLAGLVALELPALPRVALRIEAGGSNQAYETRPGGVLDGDSQHAYLGLAARYAPFAGRVAPYALAGAGLFWQSDRVILRSVDDPVPDAEYRVTTSHTAAGVIAGAGATTVLAGAPVFAEARWTRIGAGEGPTTDLTLVAGARLSLPW